MRKVTIGACSPISIRCEVFDRNRWNSCAPLVIANSVDNHLLCFGKSIIRNAVSLGSQRRIPFEACVIETLRLAMKVLDLRVLKTVIEAHRSRSYSQNRFEPICVKCDVRICDRPFL
jgi:hypothetical protein